MAVAVLALTKPKPASDADNIGVIFSTARTEFVVVVTIVEDSFCSVRSDAITGRLFVVDVLGVVNCIISVACAVVGELVVIVVVTDRVALVVLLAENNLLHLTTSTKTE